jgi:parallel beta-helix repeat protein
MTTDRQVVSQFSRIHAQLGSALAIVLMIGASASAAQVGHDCDPALLDVIKGKVVLPQNCTYHRPISIVTSNTTLDCQGSTFVGAGDEKIGLMIDSRGKPLSDVVVKNCNFKNFSSSGVKVTWNAPDTKKGTDHTEIYRRSPQRIVLDNISAQGNAGGIYLDDYVSEVTVKNSNIVDNRGVGIYLEHSSRKNIIINNTISGNGFRDAGKSKREGIAVDSSAYNTIDRNVFQGNAAGSVFLYKNCSEHFSTGKQVLRWQHSDHNTINGNSFTDEVVGVWLASRQKADLSKWDCGDKPAGGKGHFSDFADSNQLENNTFCRTVVAVKDDGKNNEILGSKSQCGLPASKKN